MTIDPQLLDILVCPESRQPLAMAGDEVLAVLNAAVASGAVVTRGGEPVTEPVAEGLLRQDGRILYTIRDGIPVMLIDESIDVAAFQPDRPTGRGAP